MPATLWKEVPTAPVNATCQHMCSERMMRRCFRGAKGDTYSSHDAKRTDSLKPDSFITIAASNLMNLELILDDEEQSRNGDGPTFVCLPTQQTARTVISVVRNLCSGVMFSAAMLGVSLFIQFSSFHSSNTRNDSIRYLFINAVSRTMCSPAMFKASFGDFHNGKGE